MHSIRTALLPGHDMRELETAFSIADALDVISGWAAEVPNGEWLTALGGIKPNQFDEKRFPTLDELNAAAPNHPVWISVASVPAAASKCFSAWFLFRYPSGPS